MKISKLLLLGMLVVALAVPAFASDIQLGKRIASPEPAAYLVGQTIHFEVTVTNPGSNPYTNTVTGVWDLLPDGSSLWLVDPNDATPLVQTPGASTTFDVYYTIDANDIIDLGGGYMGVRNYAFCDGYDSDIPPEAIGADTSKSALVVSPGIKIEKIGSIMAFCEGDDPNVVYTYNVINTGDEPLTDVNVVDNLCDPLLITDGGNDDPNLDIGETWILECEMQVFGYTLNLVTVDAIGYWTGAEVADANAWEVLELPPPVVTVTPADAIICDTSNQEFCADVEGGVGPFTYSWTLDGAPITADTNCITVSAPGDYCVTVIDTETGCDANDCGTLSTIDTPECSIDSGPISLCADQIGIPQTYCTLAVADGYLWEIIDGNATIDGNDFEPCVDVNATSLGTITLKLTLSNSVPGDGVCESDCRISILVEECGGGFCTFTQGYYGNAGGTQCGDLTTTEIINQAGLPVIVGVLGERSIELTSAACIIERLPAGGKPSALPDGIGDLVDDCGSSATAALVKLKLLKKQNKSGQAYQNVLIGQVVALTLNMRLHTIPCLDADGFNQGLGGYVFPIADYICVQKGEEGCIERYEIPESLQGLSVDDLLAAANLALAGDTELIGGAYAGASFVNELFDECLTIVTCPPEDSCDYCDPILDCVDY